MELQQGGPGLVGQQAEEIGRGHDRQEGRLVVFDVAGNEVVEFVLDSRDHLHCIFEILIGQVEGLLDRAVVNGENFDEL